MEHSLIGKIRNLQWAAEMKAGKFKGDCEIESIDRRKELLQAESERDAILKVKVIISEETRRLIEDLNKMGLEGAAKIVSERLIKE